MDHHCLMMMMINIIMMKNMMMKNMMTKKMKVKKMSRTVFGNEVNLRALEILQKNSGLNLQEELNHCTLEIF